MHLVVARMSARYTGRGNTYLAPYDRILIVKQDGAVAIHGEKGHKPLNYMMATSEKTESVQDGVRVWTFDSRTESLSVYLHEVYSEFNLAFDLQEPGLVKDGTELHLQAWIADHLDELMPGHVLVEREAQTGDGPVDILARRGLSELSVVEVKRVAPMNTVGQVLRYVDALREANPTKNVKGYIAAVEHKPKTLELAAKKGVTCITVPEDWNELAAHGPLPMPGQEEEPAHS